jgi:PAS domain S-box-containing protein
MNPSSPDDAQAILQEALNAELGALCHSIAHLSSSQILSESHLHLLRGLISLSQFAADQASEQQNSHQVQEATLESLQSELEYLRISNAVYEKQLHWMRDQEALARTVVGKLRIKAILRQTLQIGIEMTYAETGSIFLLGEDHIIEDCILMQHNTSDDERRDLVGRVLQQGLAGWVVANKTLALVEDAPRDPRWIDLPNQPYRVGSVLCLPLVNEQQLVGVMTLTHSEARHFTQTDSELVMTCAYQTALVLHNIRLTGENQRLREQVKVFDAQVQQWLQTPLVGVFLIQSNRFAHVNRKFAALAGYTKDELLQMPSIASVIAYEDRDAFIQALKECLSGQKTQFNLSFRLSRKNGQIISVMAQGLTTQIQGRRVVMAMVDTA